MTDFDISKLVGLEFDDAALIIVECNYSFRIMGEDGVKYFGNSNLNLKRVNLYLENDIVIKCHFG